MAGLEPADLRCLFAAPFAHQRQVQHGRAGSGSHDQGIGARKHGPRRRRLLGSRCLQSPRPASQRLSPERFAPLCFYSGCLKLGKRGSSVICSRVGTGVAIVLGLAGRSFGGSALCALLAVRGGRSC
eukprot:3607373-Prymnesium_polylepis.2